MRVCACVGVGASVCVRVYGGGVWALKEWGVPPTHPPTYSKSVSSHLFCLHNPTFGKMS